jgi:hypothetical protein
MALDHNEEMDIRDEDREVNQAQLNEAEITEENTI